MIRIPRVPLGLVSPVIVLGQFSSFTETEGLVASSCLSPWSAAPPRDGTLFDCDNYWTLNESLCMVFSL